jgi:hypothetical protein
VNVFGSKCKLDFELVYTLTLHGKAAATSVNSRPHTVILFSLGRSRKIIVIASARL